MARAVKTVLEIPTSDSFQVRLAELVWENAPELARKTAAGQMALGMDLDSSKVASIVEAEVAANAISELLPEVLKMVRAELAGETFRDAVGELLRLSEKKSVALQAAADAVIARELPKQVEKLVSDFLGDRLQAAVAGYLDLYFADGNLKKLVEGAVARCVDRYNQARFHVPVAPADMP